MTSAMRITMTSVTTLAALLWTQPVIADEASTTPAAPLVVVEAALIAPPSYALLPAVPGAATARRNPFGSKPMPAAALATKRGGDRVFNDAQLKGVVSDNQASNLTTGMNVISDGAFTGAAGLSTVIQNSGNNVLIQNATIVNLQLK